LVHFIGCLIRITSRPQQIQRTLLDWPRSKKLKGWKAETGERKAGVKEQGCEEQEDGEDKKEPLTAAGDQG
jgi:hypothetical protein